MKQAHPHAPAIERLGSARIRAHFNISGQALSNWKRRGVPPMLHNTMLLLGAVHGVPLPELQPDQSAKKEPTQ